jgi:DNA-binding ferritin-like protein
MSCGCKDKPNQDPYADSLDAVWRDPMEYDVQKHGPPYMPVTATQRAEARQFAERQAAYYDTQQQPQPAADPHKALSQLLAFLRTLYMVHQTAHWQTRGAHYYSDHTLFQRIYEDSLVGIDGMAEKVIGLTGEPGYVSLIEQVGLINQIASMAYQGQGAAPDPELLVTISLNGEVSLLSAIDRVKSILTSADALTEGLDDTLQGIASKHEEFVYLLQQRAAVAGYSYDRQG